MVAAPSGTPWIGRYINLDRSADRHQVLEASIARLGLSHLYHRFPAVDGAALTGKARMGLGQTACYLSHVAILEDTKGAASFLHIMEDDAVLARAFPAVINRMIANGMLAELDIVFTDVMPISPPGESLGRLWQTFADWRRTGNFRLIDLRAFPFAGTQSYIVNSASQAKVLAALKRDCGPSGMPKIPIDLLYRREIQAGRLSGACVFPFISTVSEQPSTISQQADEVPQSAFERLYEHAFFVDTDEAALLRRVNDDRPPATLDTRLEILLSIHRRMLMT